MRTDAERSCIAAARDFAALGVGLREGLRRRGADLLAGVAEGGDQPVLGPEVVAADLSQRGGREHRPDLGLGVLQAGDQRGDRRRGPPREVPEANRRLATISRAAADAPAARFLPGPVAQHAAGDQEDEGRAFPARIKDFDMVISCCEKGGWSRCP